MTFRFKALVFALGIASCNTGCSFILDFDDVNDLPCPCDPDHVCLINSNRCARRHSVDLYKSCSMDAEFPDDLCPENAICQAVNDQGPRCLPECEVSSYATPESAERVAVQCGRGSGKTCWSTERGGVCSEGVCNDLPNNCPGTQRCVRFNGAGVCFTTCSVFESNPLPCAGDQVCHPLGESSVTACVQAGTTGLGMPCSDTTLCAKTDDPDGRPELGRPMVCDRPAGSPAEVPRRCRAICAFGDASTCLPRPTEQACVLSRAGIDPQRDLGLCI